MREIEEGIGLIIAKIVRAPPSKKSRLVHALAKELKQLLRCPEHVANDPKCDYCRVALILSEELRRQLFHRDPSMM